VASLHATVIANGWEAIKLLFHRRKHIDASAIDREARTALRETLVKYMTGAIRTYEFDDENTRLRKSTDVGVQTISRFLYYFHDELVDHPISVSPDAWAAFRRIVAFLAADCEIATAPNREPWPFHDEKEWRANEHLVDEAGLPDYDPAVHGRPANRWWNRIPSSIGFIILAAILAAVFAALLLL
jgi:hypothetical protein